MTAFLFFINAFSYIHSKKENLVFRRRVPEEVMKKASAIIMFSLATVFVYQSTMSAEIKENLANELRLLKIGYEKLPKSENLKDFSAEDFRITLIDPSGKVLFESDADAEKMDNHLDRPEIISALETGKGSDTRISSTLGAEDYYYAERLEDGKILRISTDASSALSVFGNSFYILAAIIIIIAIVSVLVSMRITKRILTPIKKLSESLDNTTLYESDTYPELIPLLNEIKHQRSIQSDMRQEFTANVSHELKTPLTSISGYAEMIENGIAKEEDSKKFAAKIHTEASRMLTLIGDIIKLSKLDTGYENEPYEDVDLLEIASECKSNLSLNAERKGISITVFGKSSVIKGVPFPVGKERYVFVIKDTATNRGYRAIVYGHEVGEKLCEGEVCYLSGDTDKNGVIIGRRLYDQQSGMHIEAERVYSSVVTRITSALAVLMLVYFIIVLANVRISSFSLFGSQTGGIISAVVLAIIALLCFRSRIRALKTIGWILLAIAVATIYPPIIIIVIVLFLIKKVLLR